MTSSAARGEEVLIGQGFARGCSCSNTVANYGLLPYPEWWECRRDLCMAPSAWTFQPEAYMAL